MHLVTVIYQAALFKIDLMLYISIKSQLFQCQATNPTALTSQPVFIYPQIKQT